MRVFNKRHWPYQIRLLEGEPKSVPYVETIERFCYDHFVTQDWNNVGHYFVFKREADFTFFMLRWG